MSHDEPAPKKTETEFVFSEKDCIASMEKMPASGIDVVVTSPPYNLGINYSRYKDKRSTSDYQEWTCRWVQQVKRVLKDDGSFFLNLGACPSNPIMPFEVVCAMKDIFVLQNTIHWIKSITVRTKHGDEISAGHFKPLQGHRYLNDCHEFLFHFTKNGDVKLDRLSVGVVYADKSNIARWSHTKGRDKRCRGNTWFVPYETIKNRAADRPHPATFPVGLAENCIKLHGCNSASVMLDPFLGIGNSACAAKKCGIARFYGFEIDHEYLAVAKERVKDFDGAVKRRVKPKAAGPELFDFFAES